MGLRDNYNRISHIRQENNRINEDLYKKKSKTRISNSVTKKFETCFIGAIDSVENTFGELWGRDLPREDRTQQQVKMLRAWLALRSEILDKGNLQLRGMLRELEDYEIIYKGKTIQSFNGENR